ncbi:type I restriction endonuclease [Tautonia sp. JC769]|uniref:type I restriction endonuclease n=1 Tax=Tautonia sp. JC769 TaxID=3232135 RepID=UPI0034588361
MDLIDHLSQIAARIPAHRVHLATEEATKNALVLPLINALGYNVFDPTEVVPEFIADVGTKKGEKVDYVIMRDGKPAILIECKSVGSKLSLNHASQLFRYFTTTDARFAVLTDGIEYQFYTDIEAPNKMDSHPFFEFSMLSLDGKIVEEIKKFSKQAFDLNNILCNASELKYKKQIRGLLANEMNSPSDEFVRLFTKQVYNGPITTNVKQQFSQLVGDAFRDFIKEMVQQRIQTALDGVSPVSSSITSDSRTDDCQENEEEIVTTEEETEGYHIVRAILSKHVNPRRIVIRDTKSYCGILLDDNNRKPICRLRFNYSQKYVGLFDAQRNEEKIPIEAPTDLFKYESRLVDTIIYYTNQQQKPKSEDLAPQNGESLESLPKTELSQI